MPFSLSLISWLALLLTLLIELVSQTIGKVINGDEADITKLRGTSHSTPKKPEDYTKNVDTVNKEVDRRNFLCALIGVFLIDLCIGFQRINRVLVLL
jgi:hypothetical protein